MFRIVLNNPLDLIARGQNSAISEVLNPIFENPKINSYISDIFLEGSVNVSTLDKFKSALKGVISYGWCYKTYPYYHECLTVRDNGEAIQTYCLQDLLRAFRGADLTDRQDEIITDAVNEFMLDSNYGDSDGLWYHFTEELNKGVSYDQLKQQVIAKEWPIDIQNRILDACELAYFQKTGLHAGIDNNENGFSLADFNV